MVRKNASVVQFRRKREGRTDYKKRLKFLLSDKPRLAVRKSLKSIVIQLIEYQTKNDKVLITVHSNELRKLGWVYSNSNIPAAYLTGYLAGKKILAKNIKETILDIGLQSSGQRLFAALKGVVDAGVQVPVDEKILPSDERIKGMHISNYAEKLKKDKEKFDKQFSGYTKNKCNIDDIAKSVEQIKEKIDKK